MENKMYRIVHILGEFKNGKRIIDHNPLAAYYILEEAKKGIKDFFDTYIECLDTKTRKEISVFWSADMDELNMNYQNEQLCNFKIYEVKFNNKYSKVFEFDDFIVAYRGYNIRREKDIKRYWQVFTSDDDTKALTTKSYLGGALDFIDWLAFTMEEE